MSVIDGVFDVLVVGRDLEEGNRIVTHLRTAGHRAKTISAEAALEELRQWGNQYNVLLVCNDSPSELAVAAKAKEVFPHLKVFVFESGSVVRSGGIDKKF